MANDFVPGFLEAAGKSIVSLSKLNKTVSIVTSLVIPTLVGVYCTYYSDLARINQTLFWLPIAFFIVIGVLYSAFTWDAPLPAEALVSYLQATAKQADLEFSVKHLMALQELIYTWRSLTDEYVESQIEEPADMRGAVKVIMDTVVEMRDELFNFRPGELWNFVVYIYDGRGDLLIPVWRARHPDHPSVGGDGRTWKPGVGHVGMAFSQRGARITADVHVPGLSELLQVPSPSAREYDNKAYVSFISQPIFRGSPEAMPWGVVVATSNRADRFQEVSGLALRHAAAEIGTILSLAYRGPIPI